MTNQNLPCEGRCRCGQVRIRVDAIPLLTMACHCTGCQKMSASAFSLSVAIPAGGFSIVRGDPIIGGLHGATRHYFCPHCMSWLYTRPEGIDAFINVRATMLDEPKWSIPFIETMTSEKLPWATTGAMHSFESWPASDQYEGLMKGFADQADVASNG